MKYKVGLIRVVTLRDDEVLNIHGRIVQLVYPELHVTSRCIEDQPNGIFDRESETIAEPKILRLVKGFSDEGFDAVLVSCAADPAVSEARKMVPIPVIGAGSAVASLALTVADRVGVLNLTDETPRVIRDVLGSRIIAEESPQNVKNTIDLMSDWGKKAALDALEKMMKERVECIIFACTGYTTISFKKAVQKYASVPILDAVVAAGGATLNILRQKETV
ncbi:MAG: aspartate/glutamate racemase family protein, partial [Candidatus Caldarchaeum sp.]